MGSDLQKALIKSITLRIRESLSRIDTCLRLLKDDLIWKKTNAETNSVGNLVLHLNGNIRQYIVSGLGGFKDVRMRSAEFDLGSRIDKHDLWRNHKELVQEALIIIETLNDVNLTEKIRVQGFEINKTDVLIHVTEHYSYHTGQIALLTKLMTCEDLDFYKGQDLNKLNE